MPDISDTGQFAMRFAENSAVKITTMIAAIIFIVGGTWNVSNWKHEVEEQLRLLTRQLETRTGDRWRARDQFYFCIQLEALNDGFKCPDVAFGEE